MLALLIAVFAASSVGDAEAQAFKPKKAPAKGAAAKKAPAPAAKKAKAPRRVVTSKATKKRPNRAAESGRADDLTPDSDAPSSKTTKDDDYVLIEDDDE